MPAKRIILMYISEVSGHRSATLAIEQAIKIVQPQAEVMNINLFKYTNPISEKIVNTIYMSIIKRAPKVWDYLYDNPSIVKNIEKMKDTIHKFNSPKLKNLFDSFNPDAVICTQAFPCGMVADYKKTYGSKLPLIAVLTDYVPHSYWIYDKVDYFITPCEEVRQRLMKKGVSAYKIKIFGIPFDPKFNRQASKNELRRKLRLRAGVPTIMIMGGGQGLGPIKTIVKSLEKIKGDIQEIAVAGTNKRLYKSLSKKIKKYRKRIALFGFVKNINELMAVADIIISKPGGVTTAEALAKRIPMIIVKPIPGQEANNTEFLTKKGAAVKIDKPKETYRAVQELLANPDKLRAMRECCARIAKPNASLDIAKLTLSL
jgi:processive 1,2-diacylglycerol beta-glucosyltransferase